MTVTNFKRPYLQYPSDKKAIEERKLIDDNRSISGGYRKDGFTITK